MADNYNILEPVTTPSGTTQRSIRAIEISSQLHAGAVLVHGTSGAVLLGQSARADSIPVTLATADFNGLAGGVMSIMSATSPTGDHYRNGALDTSFTNDILINGTTAPVAGSYSPAGGTINFVIPVGYSGYNNITIGIEQTAAPVGSNMTYTVHPSTHIGTNIGVSIVITQSVGVGNTFSAFLYPALGAAISATATLTANTNFATVLQPGVPAVRIIVAGGSSGGTCRITVGRTR
jgi:hypothetical protein